MAKRGTEYTFKIDSFTPDTIPMSRLAEYMADLATLFGEHKNVHFRRLKTGTTQLVALVEHEAQPKVRDRIEAVRRQDAPREALNAYRAIDKRCAEDNASGVIVESPRTNVIEFPGRKRFTQQLYGPFNEPGSVEGVPIRIGGEHDPVPVHLEEPGADIHICWASRAVARELRGYLLETMVRAEGIGRWHREKDGKWMCDRFTIHSFKPLKVMPLPQAIAKLRSIKSGLEQVADPLGELKKIRHGS
jgi:hypothetical protein